MKLDKYGKMLAALACVCMVAPLNLTAAETGVVQTPKRAALDVSLSAGGVLKGVVIDAEGRLLAQQPVLVKFHDRVIAELTSDAQGRFAVSGLRSGRHELSAAGKSHSVRLWQSALAPEGSKQRLALVVNNTKRAQDDDDDDDTVVILAGAAVVGGIIYALVEHGDDDDGGVPATP